MKVILRNDKPNTVETYLRMYLIKDIAFLVMRKLHELNLADVKNQIESICDRTNIVYGAWYNNPLVRAIEQYDQDINGFSVHDYFPILNDIWEDIDDHRWKDVSIVTDMLYQEHKTNDEVLHFMRTKSCFYSSISDECRKKRFTKKQFGTKPKHI